jgi:hypothetical protein
MEGRGAGGLGGWRLAMIAAFATPVAAALFGRL